MPSLPQGQDYYDLYSFLEAWEERYGELSPSQQNRFLHDPLLISILLSHKYSVEASLDKFKTFKEIDEDLSFKLNTMNDYVELYDPTVEDLTPWATTFRDLGLE